MDRTFIVPIALGEADVKVLEQTNPNLLKINTFMAWVADLVGAEIVFFAEEAGLAHLYDQETP